MSPIRPRQLAAAIALAAAAAAPLAAAPLQVDPSGSGEVLLHPYYTVEGGLTTLLTLHNGDAAVKAVRLRVREGRNGRTALSMNLYLRAYEQWTAAIVDTGEGAELYSNSDACLLTPGPVEQGAYRFGNGDYTGGRRDHPLDADPALAGLGRTRSGLIEVIEMGTLVAGNGPAELADEVTGLRVNGSYQRNCAAVAAAWQGAWADDPAASIGLPRGGLRGSAQIVDVEGGALFAVPATALVNVYRVESAPGHLHRPADHPFPDLTAADHGGFVDVRVAGVEEPVRVMRAGGPGSGERDLPDAISLALLTAGMENRVSTTPELAGSANFVVSLPTKHYYTDSYDAPTGSALFVDPFADDGASCTPVRPLLADANGYGYGLRRPDPNDFFCFSPPPPPVPLPRVCGSVGTFVARNPIIGSNGPLADPAPVRIYLGSDDKTLGLDFDTARPSPCNSLIPVPAPYLEIDGVRWTGLPAIGFVAQGYLNDHAQPGRIATYDSSLPHRRLPPLER